MKTKQQQTEQSQAHELRMREYLDSLERKERVARFKELFCQ